MLPTVTYKRVYGNLLSEVIEDFFFKLIYKPLLKVINEHLDVKLNAADPPEVYLIKKIQNGDIIYDGEYFHGSFNSRSSKLLREIGAVWTPSVKGFKLLPAKLPPSLKTAVSASTERLERINDGLRQALDDTSAKVTEAVESLSLSSALEKVVAGLQMQTIKAMDAVGVKYTLTAGQKAAIKKDYTENMKLYIQDFAEEHIKTLRKEVAKNALQGYRFNKLKDVLEYRYGTTKAKAEFLAQQETSLFMSKFRQQRFMDAGVNFYRWDTVGDKKVRADHRSLDGKIFQFGDPPIVDKDSGRRGEPGEDFRCRCIARPIVQKVHKVGGLWQIVD